MSRGLFRVMIEGIVFLLCLGIWATLAWLVTP